MAETTQATYDPVIQKRTQAAKQRAEIWSEILALKRRYNQLAAISRLPSEILSTIFEWIKAEDLFLSDTIHFYLPSVRWIQLTTHVCHSWREAALQNTSLWKDIDVRAHAAWTIEFANRSKDAPIHIISNNNTRPAALKSLERLLCKTVRRVQKLTLDHIPPDDIPDMLSFASFENEEGVVTSALRELQLGLGSQSLPTFLVNDDMLSAPMLKKLSLKACSIDWRSLGLLRNLSHLAISDVEFDAIADAESIHNALCQMPNIEELVLNCFPAQRQSTVIPPPIVEPTNLPKLRAISISTSASSFAWLSSILHGIAYGPKRNIRILVTPDALAYESFLSLFSCVMEHAQASSIHSVCLTAGPPAFIFDGWRTTASPPWQHEPSITVGARALSTSEGHPPSEFVLKRLFRTVPLRNVQMLKIVFMDLISAATWEELFGSLAHLHTVDIYSGMRELASAMVYHTERTEANHSSLPFQALRTIFVEGRNSYSDEDNRLISICLQKRANLGVPLDKLVIVGYGKYQDNGWDIEALREVVGSVVLS